MSSFSDLVNKLESKVLILLEQKRALTTEVEVFRNEIAQLQKENKQLNEQLLTLEERNQILRIAKGKVSKEERAEMKLKINEIVREVDKCISQLNQ